MSTPICDFVRRYRQSDPVRFHMPGHKGYPFLGFEPLDITEIDGADELFTASGIIAESEALRPLLPGAELGAQDVSAALEAANALCPGRFRLIPCAGVTAERALLLCFRPDAVYVDGHRRRDLLAAVSPRVLCPDGEYSAIV